MNSLASALTLVLLMSSVWALIMNKPEFSESGESSTSKN
jgi:hypothetical protein